MKLKLLVVSQESQLVSTEADMVIAPTTTGEITILPKHIPIYSKLQTGELSYTNEGMQHWLIISDGFITVSPENEVVVIVDAATLARDVSEQKAREAVQAAKKTMETSTDRRELLMAEASLKKAMLEIKLAQQSKRTSR
ncbi:MAG: ATP synthase F1 subunit epsilon [Microgenomates group bacterium]